MRAAIGLIAVVMIVLALGYMAAGALNGRDNPATGAGGNGGRRSETAGQAPAPKPTIAGYPVPTWDAPTRDPLQGAYHGMSAAEVASALADALAPSSSVPIDVAHAVDVHPADAQRLGLSPELVSEDGSPDVGVVLSGSFMATGPGLQGDGPYAHYLIVADRTTGHPYHHQWSEDLDPLLDMLPGE